MRLKREKSVVSKVVSLNSNALESSYLASLRISKAFPALSIRKLAKYGSSIGGELTLPMVKDISGFQGSLIRREFLKNLALQLMKPLLFERSMTAFLPSDIKVFLQLYKPPEDELHQNVNEPPMKKRSRCVPCGRTFVAGVGDRYALGTETVMSAKGSMTTAVFVHWLDQLVRYKVAGEVVLILDGASSHLDANITSATDNYGITLYYLSSNTTHELQPIDKVQALVGCVLYVKKIALRTCYYTVRVSVLDSKVAMRMGSLHGHLPEVMRSGGSVDG
ncbi:hypothetical protein ANN_04028 [Periplaneta americana]|uniref:DDE-1 domain-containing protein n=1 Tax=Periplaneta americana TaxID=6978 RepID=A0ABQ8T9F7_PERAM|nr:hypothetical protein ANN_04028 [Periplaneta americana]